MKPPTVSILLAARNAAATLSRTLASITEQTYTDYEVIIVDDASTDTTPALLKQKPASRWRILTNQTNLGLTKSLNRGLAHARGNFIARLDADDWWEPDKLEKQTDFLAATPDVGVLGCWYINHRPHTKQPIKLPVTHREVSRRIYKSNPFGHSCVLIRRSLLNQVDGYDNELRYAQDRDLWFRLLPHTQFYNLPEFLVHRTIPARAISARKKIDQITTSLAISRRYMKKYQAPWYTRIFLLEPHLVRAYYYLYRLAQKS